MRILATFVLAVALGVAVTPAAAQTNLILNGDFESNEAEGCHSNLSNEEFDGLMASATAFGSAGEIDIYRGICIAGSSAPQSGVTKIAINTRSAGGEGGFDAFSFDLAQPLVAGATYTLKFYAQNIITTDPGEVAAPVQVGLSDSATSFGTLIFTSGIPSTTAWTEFTHIFTAPFAASFLTVRNEQSGPTTKETWNHLDNFSLVAAAAPLTITTVATDINPWGVAANNGTLYVADRDNHVVWQVPSAGGTAPTIVAGILGQAGFNGDVNADGSPRLAVAARLSGPRGVAFANGSLFIAEENGHRVRRVVLGTGQIFTVAGTGAADYSGDGGPATAAALHHPRDVAVNAAAGTAGVLFIADSLNQRVRAVDLVTGIISTVAGTGVAGFNGDFDDDEPRLATTAQLNGPSGLAIGPGGSLYIADTGNERIRRVAGGVISTVAGNGTPTVLLVDDESGEGTTTVTAPLGDGGPPTAATLNSPTDVAVDADGTVYIADFNNNRVRAVPTEGDITTFAGTGVAGDLGDGGPATAAQLNRPAAVARDSDGRVFIGDLFNQRVRMVAPAPVIP